MLSTRSRLFIRPNGRQVYFDIGERVRSKTVGNLAIPFELVDYDVLYRGRLNRLTVAIVLGIMWHKRMTVLWRRPSLRDDLLYVTDRPIEHLTSTFQGRLVEIKYDLHPALEVGASDLAFPTLMHPQIYLQYREHERLAEYRKLEKRYRLAFAGNVSEGYANPVFKELFGMLSRYEIVTLLSNHRATRIIGSESELLELQSERYFAGIVIIDPERFRVTQDKWLSFVAQSDFFICPPGVLYPPSHNAVEAMAVGSIPFVNYPHWFYPSLRHMKNCISFGSVDDLQRQVNGIISMESFDIANLRAAAIDYYAAYLSPESFVERVVNHSSSRLSLHVLEENEDFIRASFQQ